MQKALWLLLLIIASAASIPAPAALKVASREPFETGVSWSKKTIWSSDGNLARVSLTNFSSWAAKISDCSIFIQNSRVKAYCPNIYTVSAVVTFIASIIWSREARRKSSFLRNENWKIDLKINFICIFRYFSSLTTHKSKLPSTYSLQLFSHLTNGPKDG